MYVDKAQILVGPEIAPGVAGFANTDTINICTVKELKQALLAETEKVPVLVMDGDVTEILEVVSGADQPLGTDHVYFVALLAVTLYKFASPAQVVVLPEMALKAPNCWITVAFNV